MKFTLSFILTPENSSQGKGQMKMSYLGNEIPKLGFGLMRLPMAGGEIDLEQVKQMVDRFMAQGFTYFDTAYVYHGGKSEVAAREALVKRYPREAYQLATKLPVWMANKPEDLQPLFDTQLERTGAGYIDYYLLHALDRDRIVHLEKIGAWEFGRSLKEQGLIRHLGFSFHDEAKYLDELLTSHPEAEFVQLQINYADWEDDKVQSRLCYEIARKHNKPVIIMEPLKGGALAAMGPEVQALFKATSPNDSVASWALRFAASLDGIITVLSGMSNTEQMDDNLATMAQFQPLSADDRAVIAQALEELKKVPTVPCTACRYCTDDCPQKINIPGVFDAYNNYLRYQNADGAKGNYRWAVGSGGKASACIACGACESHCPQHIPIINRLADAAKILE